MMMTTDSCASEKPRPALPIFVIVVSLLFASFQPSSGQNITGSSNAAASAAEITTTSDGALLFVDANNTVTLGSLLGRLQQAESAAASAGLQSSATAAALSSVAWSAANATTALQQQMQQALSSAIVTAAASQTQQLSVAVSAQQSTAAVQAAALAGQSSLVASLSSQLAAQVSVAQQLSSQLATQQTMATLQSSALAQLLQSYNLTFSQTMTVPTHGAVDWEVFTINNVLYLACSFYHNDTTGDIESQIYTFSGSGSGSQLTPFQTIPGTSPLDMEFFTIQNDSFLAVANSYNSASITETISQIYKFNGTRFQLYQSFNTHGSTGCESFTIQGSSNNSNNNSNSNSNSNTFLVFTNNLWAGNSDIDSQILKYNPGTRLFANFQNITTHAVWDVLYFNFLNGDYLVFVNRNSLSQVVKFDGSVFQPFQLLAVSAGTNADFVNINGIGYLAVSSTTNNTQVFRFNGTVFTPLQLFVPGSSSQAYGVLFFNYYGSYYLAVANYRDSQGNGRISSPILKFDSTRGIFVPFQSISTIGAYKFTFFTYDGLPFLAVAGYYDFSYNINSSIWRMQLGAPR